MTADPAWIYIKYVVFMSLWPSTIKILISNLPRTRKFSQLFKNTGREDQILTMVTRWSRSTSNFYALIGQNLTGEFMRKIYAASWNLFTLTAEADRVLCQLVIFLMSFSTGCAKWNTAAIKSLLLFMASLFIGFLVEEYVACQSRKSDFGWHSFGFHLAWCVRGLQSLKRYWLFLIPFRSCISNGEPEKLLHLMFVLLYLI